MTTAVATQPLAVGDYVRLVKGGTYISTAGSYNIRLDDKTTFKITREYTDRYTIRKLNPQSYSYNSFNVPKNAVTRAEKPIDPATVPAGKIGPDHPDLQWLWKRAADIATEEGHCSEYDKIAEKLGIPGRERNFTVTVDVKGLRVTSKIKARSRVEAEKKVKEALNK